MAKALTRCGLVALVGAPNVGKSSLLNRLVGEDVGIVSRKANTTRIVVRGMVTHEASQVIFVDTPGLNDSKKSFDRLLVQQARGALDEADVIALVIDAGRGFDERAEEIVGQLKKAKGKQTAVLILNKVDRVQPRAKLLELMTRAQAENVFSSVFAVSAIPENTKKSGVADIVPQLAKLVPEGPWLFPDCPVTDMPLPFRLAEVTRGISMQYLHEEIPYGMAVLPVEIDDGAEPVLVRQLMLVSREAHKGMVIGKGGQMLKRIGTEARSAMEKIIGDRVRVELSVEVDENWFGRADMLRELGVIF